MAAESSAQPHLGIFGSADGEQFAFLLVASPVIVNLVMLLAPGGMHWSAVPLLMLAQASLVIADRRKLARTATSGVTLPSHWWSLFAVGWLYHRGRFQTPARPFAGIWCLASVPFLLPFIALVSNPDWKHANGASNAPATAPGATLEGFRHPGRVTGSAVELFRAIPPTPIRPEPAAHPGGLP